MKKTVTLLMSLMILAAVAAPTFAQGRSSRAYSAPARSTRVYNDQRIYNESQRVYNDRTEVYYDYSYRNRSFWDRHRDKLTLAIGAGSGAAVGGLIGGKRGAIIGAASGLGASALYTYKIRDRRRY